jgi:hypothetical protein
MASHGKGVTVKTRLYLEGRLVENAFVKIQVQGSVGAPGSAQIELVPTNTIKHILPFTWVHVFTTDPWDQDPKGDLSDYKLLFEGVVIGRGPARQDEGRSFVISCAHVSIFWAQARQFWLNITSAGGGLVDQIVIQTSGGYGRFGTASGTGAFSYLYSKLAFQQSEERFMDTLIGVLDDIGNVNPLYTNARNRLRLTDRIIRGPAGKTEKLFQIALLSDFLEGLGGRQSDQTSLLDVVNQLLSAIMHEWVSVVAPPYLKTRIFDRDVFGNIKRERHTVTRPGEKDTVKVDLFDSKTATDEVIGDTIFKPHVYTISPPSCNVLFPNMYDRLSSQEDFLNQTTRMQMRPQLPLLNQQVTMGLYLLRPTELEIFTALTRDPEFGTSKRRSPDGKFGDGAGQAPTFHDYDWATNEERIRGIVYNFINLAPAPSTLTLSDPGKREPSGVRVGGMPQYLQNVASYDFYKSKYAPRQTGLSGPYNMRPVAGFPLVALDDSEANTNIVAYLSSITHLIDSSGNATTQYGLSYTRLVNEVDYNRPRFKGGQSELGELDFDLVRDENGQYRFETLFDGKNRPPIPEWFDESFRTLQGLDVRYREWFGDQCRVLESILFQNPESDDSGAISAANDTIDLSDAVEELNRRYRLARNNGQEFVEASAFTARSFTRIDQAFRFVGAGPLELADASPEGFVQFKRNTAAARQIDFARARLDMFVGDVSPGSGYAGQPEGDKVVAPTKTTKSNTGVTTTASAPTDRMSGAFPTFDTTLHTGEAATSQSARDALLQTERAPTDRARYDGRPIMHDFEFRLWQESLKAAGYAPTGEKIADNAQVAAHFVTEGGSTRPATAQERAAALQQQKTTQEKRRQEERARTAAGRARPGKSRTPRPEDQAPTGDGLQQNERLPLPQPLSEKQVIDLRRAIIDAYRDELARTRGFTG